MRPSPLFLAVVAVMAVGGGIAWTQNDAGSEFGNFGVFLFVLAGWVVSVCFHEFAHAYAAFRAGDRSVETRGYLTLNPFKYAHPFLSLILPLVFIVQGGIGLPGGAVYLHQHAFRSRLSRSLASAVGPLVNVVLAVALLVAADHQLTTAGTTHQRFWYGVAFLGFLQATAAVLNLLPVPGLDGWGILEPYLSRETVALGNRIKPWGLLAVMVLLIVSNDLNRAFFRLVDWVAERTGAPDILWAVGYDLFRFWT